MKTKKKALAYLKSLEGKLLDFDGSYGYQCYDLANFYWYYTTGRTLTGLYAKNIPWDNDFSGYATVYKNTPQFLAKPGDLVVFNGNYGKGAGHVAVVLSATLNKITVIENNWVGGGWVNEKPGWERATKRTHPYDTEMWFIRPKFSKSKTKETVKKVAKASVKKATPKKTYSFKVGGAPIITRIGKPSLKARSGGSVKPNQTMTFNKLVKSEGYEWGKLTNYKGQTEYVPIRPLNKGRNAWGVLK